MPTAPRPIPKFDIYKFVAPYEYSVCVSMGGTGGVAQIGSPNVGNCNKYEKFQFKIGDTIIGGAYVSDGVNPPTINGGTTTDGGMNGGTVSIPASKLNKVATRIDVSELSKYRTVKSDTTTNNIPITKGEEDGKQKSTEENKNIFTPKNIIIGVLAIGAILGLLKWQKVI